MENIKSATIYLPNGDVENFTVGKSPLGRGVVKDINLLNNGVIAVIYEDGSEAVFVNMPFIFNH